MSTVRVDFTNTGSGIVQVSYSKSQTTNVSNFSVSSGQITSYNLDTNATYDFKFVLGRQEIPKSWVSLISNKIKNNSSSDL